MELYMIRGCPFGHRAAIALREKKLNFQIDFFQRGKRPPELEAVGPQAKSPTLFDGDVRVFDSQIVLEYLEDRYPEWRLLPGDAAERAKARMFASRVTEELMPKAGAVMVETVLKPERDGAKIAEASRGFVQALKPWDAHFADREFAVGDAFSLADITLYTIFPSLRGLAGIEIPSDHPHLRAWHDRVAARSTTHVPQPQA